LCEILCNFFVLNCEFSCFTFRLLVSWHERWLDCNISWNHLIQVVVKPFGPSWNSCKGVTYHPVDDIDSIMEAVHSLLTKVETGTGILLQSFIYTLDPVVTFGLGRHAVNTERKCFSTMFSMIAPRFRNWSFWSNSIVTIISTLVYQLIKLGCRSYLKGSTFLIYIFSLVSSQCANPA